MSRERSGCVMVLYKYFRPEYLRQVLQQRLLRFTQPGALNDPFEMKPYYVGDDAWEHLRSWLVGHASELLGSDRGILGKDLQNADRPRLASALDAYNNHMFGILSLSEKSNDLLMWSHYAEGHRGFVLGFDSTHSFFNWLHLPANQVYKVAKVSYSDERPQVAMSTLMDAHLLYMVKSRSWEYEQEWRFISLLENADVIKRRCRDYAVHLFRYPVASLREVILGCRAEDSLLRMAKQILKAEPTLSHVVCHRAVEHSESFTVGISRFDI